MGGITYMVNQDELQAIMHFIEEDEKSMRTILYVDTPEDIILVRRMMIEQWGIPGYTYSSRRLSWTMQPNVLEVRRLIKKMVEFRLISILDKSIPVQSLSEYGAMGDACSDDAASICSAYLDAIQHKDGYYVGSGESNIGKDCNKRVMEYPPEIVELWGLVHADMKDILTSLLLEINDDCDDCDCDICIRKIRILQGLSDV